MHPEPAGQLTNRQPLTLTRPANVLEHHHPRPLRHGHPRSKSTSRDPRTPHAGAKTDARYTPKWGQIRRSHSRRAVLEPGAFFEVADGELDGGVIAVELVNGDGGPFDVGDEGVVAPVGPQPSLRGFGETGAA